MPGFGTSARTRGNAERLAEACGVALDTIDITDGCRQQFRDIGHDPDAQDVTFENVQARYRTIVLMNKANQMHALVVGTGDLSEIALGWNTFNGDHISHYNVNAGVPKTLVRHVVGWAAAQPEFARARGPGDILEHSDLTGTGGAAGAGRCSRRPRTSSARTNSTTSSSITSRGGRAARPRSCSLARQAFPGRYDAAAIRKWLRVFVQRFFGNQWKRSVMPDGPKVGSVALSPRGRLAHAVRRRSRALAERSRLAASG